MGKHKAAPKRIVDVAGGEARTGSRARRKRARTTHAGVGAAERLALVLGLGASLEALDAEWTRLCAAG